MTRASADRPIRSSSAAARALLVSAVWAALVSAFPAPAAAAEPVTGAQVRAAILRAVDALRDAQNADGTWPDYAQKGGVTALVTYALLEAGVAPRDDRMAKAVEHVRGLEHRSTYVVSLKVLALAAADARQYAAEIQAGAEWLVAHQTATGAWGYGTPPPAALAEAKVGGALEAARNEAELRRQYERPDASNSQFALLALAEADRAGAKVPLDVWQRADRHFRTVQLPGGGWSYVYHDADPDEAYGSITAAVAAGLYLCHERLAGHEPAATTAERLQALEEGIGWIAEHYTLQENPNRAHAWYYFWLYALERLGVVSGRRTFGNHEWFPDGVALLVRGQRSDGRWTDRLYHDALCLLFLAKGYRPLLVQRLRWEGAWRKDPRDLNHLVAYLGARVGGDPVGWRTLEAEAPVADYLAAPILHVTGHGALRMLASSAPRLPEYIRQGGLVLVDPAGGDTALVQSVRGLMADAFPEAKFQPLPADHPLARAVHRVDPKALGLEALGVGCRVGVVLATRGLGDAWAVANPGRPDDALRFGENLAAYAAGGAALPDRLAEPDVRTLPEADPSARADLRVGQIQHGGQWNPRPFALPNVLEDLARRFAVRVASRPEPVRLAEADLSRYNVLYLTGHGAIDLADADRAALKGYLARGGFLWAHACCGRPEFDKAVRGLVVAMFPGQTLDRLPADHPLLAGKVGTPVRSVAYSEAVRAETPDLKEPVLYGLDRGGHLVLVYSPYGLADGMDGLRTYGARAVAPADARHLAINVLLYGLAEP
jgi:hypothetical protein